MLARLAAWDARTMMPALGGPARAQQTATLERLMHERGTADELGEWIEAAEGLELGALDRDIVRIARRDWERVRRVPADLAAELAQAGAEGQDVWQAAREAGDFAAFAPALERNVELARAYAACFDAADPYDALLGEYDHGLTAARVQEVFARLADALPPLVAEAAARGPGERLALPVDAQRAAVRGALRRLGADEDSWRIDESAHPFSTAVGPLDSRMTTRYEPGHPMAVIAAMHEFGHALYERQIDLELDRTNLGEGTSMSIHESQSKLWENHVARNRGFARVLAEELGRGGFAVEPGVLHAAMTRVEPSLVRVAADPVTYPLHIVLRFELERALIDGTLAVSDLPDAFDDGMRRLLGIEVPGPALGVMQDAHWGAAAFGYFPSYALGCLIAAQLWETLVADVGEQDEALATADVAAVREWLRTHVHRFGRRIDTEPLVEAATGRGLDPEPFLRYARSLTST
jgi:carboxypeptidase Taq